MIYFYYRPDCPLYLLLAYGKAQATDLTQDEKKAVATLGGNDQGHGGLSVRSMAMTDFGKELIAAMEEAAAHAQRKGKVARVHTIEVPDVKAIREELGLSQQAFASAYHIPLATLKGWEQGRRQPDATASAYLSVIARLPDQARDVLQAA